jgi:hypothetical protein
MQPKYRGPERRQHRMYVTRNTEYHFRGDLCVAVRDLRTGTWLPSHLAVSRRLTGSVRVLDNGTAVPNLGTPSLGDALYFGDEARELITSKLCGVERPARQLVDAYPGMSAAAE